MKFLRRNSDRHSKLGRNRKKKQKWRRPTGRHNKMRDKRRGYPAVVSVGYRKSAKGREKLDGMKPIYIMNVKDIAKIGKQHRARPRTRQPGKHGDNALNPMKT